MIVCIKRESRELKVGLDQKINNLEEFLWNPFTLLTLDNNAFFANYRHNTTHKLMN